MATIDDLITKFTDLNQKEAYAFIGNLRAERRVKPESPKAYRKATKGTREAKAKIKGVSKLTPDQLAKVLTKEQKIRLLREMGVDV